MGFLGCNLALAPTQTNLKENAYKTLVRPQLQLEYPAPIYLAFLSQNSGSTVGEGANDSCQNGHAGNGKR